MRKFLVVYNLTRYETQHARENAFKGLEKANKSLVVKHTQKKLKRRQQFMQVLKETTRNKLTTHKNGLKLKGNPLRKCFR